MKIEIVIKTDDGKTYEGNANLILKGQGGSKVKVKEHTSTKSRATPQDRILEMVDDGVFKTPKSPLEIKDELWARGHHYNLDPQIRVALLRLIRKRDLRRIGEGKAKQKTYKYVNM